MICLNNEKFNIIIDETTGCITSIKNPADNEDMNWCVDGAQWGKINSKNTDMLHNHEGKLCREMTLEKFSVQKKRVASVYSNGMLKVTVLRFFTEDGNFRERYTVENMRDSDVFIAQNNFGIILPVNDRYPSAEECMRRRCHAHIWCGKSTSYINALRMGKSDINLGVVLTRGALESYSQLDVWHSNRGIFQFNSLYFTITPDEKYILEWELFWHNGNSDFENKIGVYPQTIVVKSDNYTVFLGEKIRFSFDVPKGCSDISVLCRDCEVPYTVMGRTVFAEYTPSFLGEYRFDINAGGIETYTEFFVSEDVESLVLKRLDFISEKQQYLNKNSDLYGAYLIYDTKEKHHIFDGELGDHNACRERVGMALLMAKYLQTHSAPKLYTSLMLFIEFLKREFYDEERGMVYGDIHKNEKRLRLYNAPWIVQLFSEMYLLTKDSYYSEHIVKILRRYYELGGANFYPNGISFVKALSALKAAKSENINEVIDLFKSHAENIIKKGIYYPPHEVNYEQTIVTPAVTLISEIGAVTGEKRYTVEAKAHIETLERFSGHQPSFHLNEIPIRFWDDFWFGKGGTYGDTFPHYWSCLTARAFADYYSISGDEKYHIAAKRCIKNCLCLFNERGEGSCAYVYPYYVNGKRGEFYDEWANDQDYALYFYLDIAE